MARPTAAVALAPPAAAGSAEVAKRGRAAYTSGMAQHHFVPLRSDDRDDRDLLRRLLADDAGAWQDLVQKYAGVLLTAAGRCFRAYGYAASVADREDAVADVWQNLLEHDRRLLRTCLERDNLWPTLHVLVRHRSIDLMRKQRIQPIGLVEDQVHLPAGDAADADALDPDELAAAMATLTQRQRVVVTLFFLQRKTYRQISGLTGIPQNSIGPTLARALARLRQTLEAATPAAERVLSRQP